MLSGFVYPSGKGSFFSLLTGNYVQILDTAVHTDGILPVVTALSVLGVVLNAGCLIGIHCFAPYALLDATYFNTGIMLIIDHIFNPPRRKITLRGTGETDRHGIIALAISGERYLSEGNRLVGTVIGAVIGRIVVGIGIYTEYAEVARVTRPHPVIRIAAKLTHRGGRRHYHTYIVEYFVHNGIVLISGIEGNHLSLDMIVFTITGCDFFAQLVNHINTLRFVRNTGNGFQHFIRYIIYTMQISYRKTGDGQFVL